MSMRQVQLLLVLFAACATSNVPSTVGVASPDAEAPPRDASAQALDALSLKPDASLRESACVVGTVPGELRTAWALSAFYVKYTSVDGFPILSSAKVQDRTLCVAREVVFKMTEERPEMLARMIQRKIRLAIMAETEFTTDIPEHSDLTPKDFWDQRARGLGATIARPAVSAAEENILCRASDRYRGESILVHEFSHALFNIGIELDEPAKATELEGAYAAATQAGLFANTYAATNRDEYWAEGTQNWFDTNASAIPSNGIHNEVHTRAQLETYDLRLSTLLASVFGRRSWRYACPP
jgi:hypothetical protein